MASGSSVDVDNSVPEKELSIPGEDKKLDTREDGEEFTLRSLYLPQ